MAGHTLYEEAKKILLRESIFGRDYYKTSLSSLKPGDMFVRKGKPFKIQDVMGDGNGRFLVHGIHHSGESCIVDPGQQLHNFFRFDRHDEDKERWPTKASVPHYTKIGDEQAEDYIIGNGGALYHKKTYSKVE